MDDSHSNELGTLVSKDAAGCRGGKTSRVTKPHTPRKSRSLELVTSIVLIFQMFAIFFYISHTTTSPLDRASRGEMGLNDTRQDSSCFLTKKLEKANMPILHSFFADPVREEVVAVGVRFWFEQWHEEAFICEFRGPDGKHFARLTDPMLEDYQRFGAKAQYVLIMTCPLPKPLVGVTKFTMTLRRALVTSLAYENITVCSSGLREGRRTRFLSMCTMVKNMDSAVPPWLDYHRHLGVEHVYIYDNSDASTLHQTAQRYVDSGFLTIIPWAHVHSHGKTYLEVQIAHENDCLWRNRYQTQWMIKIDVDEFLQPMNPMLPLITDVLRSYGDVMDTVGSLRVQNWFFCRAGRRNQTQPRTNRVPGDSRQESVFERNQFRRREPTAVNTGRDKAVVRPTNVHFFKIHGVKLGGDTITLSPWTEMRMVHYRGDNRLHSGFKCSDSQPVKDGSMCRIWAQAKGFSLNASEPNGISCL